MSLVDHKGKVVVNYSQADTFNAMLSGLAKLKGFKMVNSDNTLYKIDLKAGMSAFSWGENLTITFSVTIDGKTEVAVLSTPKTGMLGGGAMDMGKNQKNIDVIFKCLSEQLKNFHELPLQSAKKVSDDDPVAKLEKLQQMLDRHLISQSEFDEKKKQLLSVL